LNKKKGKLVLPATIFLSGRGGWSAADGGWWRWGAMCGSYIMPAVTSLIADLTRTAAAVDYD
jgi:hypothetical protein